MKTDKKQTYAIWFFLKQYKAIYAALLLVTIGYAILESVNISIFVPLFNAVLNNEKSTGKLFLIIEKIVSFLPFKHPFMGIFVLAITISIIKELFGFTRVFLVGCGLGKVYCDTQEALIHKYGSSDYQFFLDNKQGKLVYVLLNATAKLSNCLQIIPDMVTAILMIFTIGALLFSISLRATVFLSFFGVIYVLMMNMLAKKVSYNIGKERVVVGANTTVLANELLDGIKHIKVSGSFWLWQRNFSDSVRRFKALVIRDFMWSSVPDRVIQLLPVAILVGVAMFLYFTKDAPAFLSKYMISMGVYIYAFYRLSPFLASLGKLRMQLMVALPDVEVLYDALNQKTNYIEDGDFELKNIEKEVRFENVSFSYKNKKDIFRNVNFSIEKGKTTAIVGTSGAGKSTLINLIARLFDPEDGRIVIDGIDLRKIKHSSLINLIGMVSQDTFIFNGTIKENIIFGLKDVTDERLLDAVKLANASDFISHFPEGYETGVGDKGLKLSGGQRQRLAIARAILRDPKILILDEATSSLDYHSEALVQSAINIASKNRTVIVIAHRLSTVIRADKIIVLDHGRVVEEGDHNELMRRNGVYKALYESQERNPHRPDPEEGIHEKH